MCTDGSSVTYVGVSMLIQTNDGSDVSGAYSPSDLAGFKVGDRVDVTYDAGSDGNNYERLISHFAAGTVENVTTPSDNSVTLQ